MYLYFNETLKKIVACVAPTEKEGLTPLTAEQVDRWEENPRAHWSQIMNGPQDVEKPSLDTLKNGVLTEFKSLGFEILDGWVDERELLAAIVSMNADEKKRTMNEKDAASIIETYLNISKQCGEAYVAAKTAIEKCGDAEGLEKTANEWRSTYEGLRKKEGAEK